MIPRRKRDPRDHLPMGAARWLLGAAPQLDGMGSCSHGAIIRWRHLIVHQSGRQQWEKFQEDYWDLWRNTIIAWHLVRGWQHPPGHLRGHEAERAWLWGERHEKPRLPKAQWSEQTL